jgi:alkylation response protein AidB-like acyl-CoA dehydrogenase
MNIRPSEEQSLLRDMVARLLADLTPAAEAGRGPITDDAWAALAELGVLAATLPDSVGGMDGGPRDAALIGEELGRALAITPFAEGVLAALDLVARYGTNEQIERWVAPALAGQRTLSLVVGDVAITGDRVDGRCAFARWCASADAFVVVSDALAVIVPAGAPGLLTQASRLADGSEAATLTFDDVVGEPLPLPAGAAAAAIAMAQVGYVAELVGIMALLQQETVDYAQQRRQFGTPIASFQVIQHKLARMFVRLEQSRSMLLKATLMPRDDDRLPRLVMAAKAYVGEAAMMVAEEAVQIHGGMGVTDEMAVGRALRRVLVLARLFGRPDEARQVLAA